MKIEKYIRKKPCTIEKRDNYTILSVASLILATQNDSVIVLENQKPVYVLTNADIIGFFVSDQQHLSLLEIMQSFPKKIFTIKKNADVYEGYKLMREKMIQHLIVVDKDNSLIGVVFYSDLIMKFVEYSFKDELTGLNNRRFLDTIIKRYSHSQEKIGVIFIDLDNFKQLNDTYGHKEGDIVLSQMGEKIVRSVRELDFAFRYGGDEFLVFLFDCTKEILRNVSQRIFDKLSAIRIHDKNISISMGAVLYPDHCQDLDECIKKADKIMFQAKENGKNGVLIYED